MSEFQISILFFAKSKEIVGSSNVMMTVNKSKLTGEEVLETIVKTYPK